MTLDEESKGELFILSQRKQAVEKENAKLKQENTELKRQIVFLNEKIDNIERLNRLTSLFSDRQNELINTYSSQIFSSQSTISKSIPPQAATPLSLSTQDTHHASTDPISVHPSVPQSEIPTFSAANNTQYMDDTQIGDLSLATRMKMLLSFFKAKSLFELDLKSLNFFHDHFFHEFTNSFTAAEIIRWINSGIDNFKGNAMAFLDHIELFVEHRAVVRHYINDILALIIAYPTISVIDRFLGMLAMDTSMTLLETVVEKSLADKLKAIIEKKMEIETAGMIEGACGELWGFGLPKSKVYSRYAAEYGNPDADADMHLNMVLYMILSAYPTLFVRKFSDFIEYVLVHPGISDRFKSKFYELGLEEHIPVCVMDINDQRIIIEFDYEFKWG